MCIHSYSFIHILLLFRIKGNICSQKIHLLLLRIKGNICSQKIHLLLFTIKGNICSQKIHLSVYVHGNVYVYVYDNNTYFLYCFGEQECTLPPNHTYRILYYVVSLHLTNIHLYLVHILLLFRIKGNICSQKIHLYVYDHGNVYAYVYLDVLHIHLFIYLFFMQLENSYFHISVLINLISFHPILSIFIIFYFISSE